MTQPWLTVTGIALDLAGFMVLLREWWLAVFNEKRLVELAEQLDRMRLLRTVRPRMAGEPDASQSLDIFANEQAIHRTRVEYRSALNARRSVFLLAATMIVAGFGLQLAGAWPG